MNIGIFDSGLGGLWLLRHIRKELPQYNYVFFGDQANVPYGNKSKQELFEITTRVLRYLFEEKNCACVLLACNTTSSSIFSYIQDWVEREYPDRVVLDIVTPTQKVAPDNALVFGTMRTIESGAYNKEGRVTRALPELASRIEYGDDTHAYIQSQKDIVPPHIHTGVLCCTHYGIVRDDFKKIYPEITEWIYQEDIAPKYMKEYINSNMYIGSRLRTDGKLEIHISQENPLFNKWFKEWYDENILIELTVI